MRHGSFFTGIGGFDIAAQRVGWENVFHCEIDDYNRRILKRHFPESISYADIKDFNGYPYKDTIDIVSGGFPCQDISIAKTYGGSAGIKGTRSGLWKEYERAIREIGPGIIVFENSPMLTRRGFETVLCDLSKLGYHVEWRCFYAAQFGYPHLRKRLYGVAYSVCKRWSHIAKDGGILRTVLPESAPRSGNISMPAQRFNRYSDYSRVRMDDGFSDELDRRRVKACGNAVLPDIPEAIFSAINLYTK